MKAQFLKVRVIASLLMISVLFACAAIDSMTRESSHATVQQEQPVVIIYSTEWCHWCKKAKAFMNEKKICLFLLKLFDELFFKFKIFRHFRWWTTG